MTDVEARNTLLRLVRYLGSDYMVMQKDGRIMCQDKHGVFNGYLVYASHEDERPFGPYQYVRAMSGFRHLGALQSIVGYVVTISKHDSRRLEINSLDELAIRLELEGFPAA